MISFFTPILGCITSFLTRSLIVKSAILLHSFLFVTLIPNISDLYVNVRVIIFSYHHSFLPHSLLFIISFKYIILLLKDGKARIESASMAGTDRRVVVWMNETGGGWPNGISLDYTLMRLYWIDAKSDSIHCCLYNGDDSRKASVEGLLLLCTSYT